MNNEQRNESLRLSLIAWLESNDPNGCYSDEDCLSEGFPIMTITDAMASIALQLDGQHSFDMREG